MSLDLVELSKIKVSIECHSLLNAHASVLSKHQNEVARLVLEKYCQDSQCGNEIKRIGGDSGGD